MLTDGTHIIRAHDIDETFRRQWISLFQRCFGSTQHRAARVFRKYELNDCVLCCLFQSGQMIAAYCGIKLRLGPYSGFLSTDTMSDGTKLGASVHLAKTVYDTLQAEDITVIFGYPNKNIRKIRVRALGWTLTGSLSLYIGFPFLWRFIRNKPQITSLWSLVRPPDGWYTRNRPALIHLLGRDSLYSDGLGFVMTLSAYSPGFFFIRVPSRFFEPRTFGFRILTDDEIFRHSFVQLIPFLDLDTIDIP